MQGRSSAFDATVVQPHIAVAAVDIIQDGKVVLQPSPHSGSATADRMADQMREFQVELADPTGTFTPVDMNSILAPYGSRMQLYKGVREESVDTHAQFFGTQQSWLPSGNSTGDMNGVKLDSTGALTLGP